MLYRFIGHIVIGDRPGIVHACGLHITGNQFQGSKAALVTVIVYAVIFGGYIIARIWRAVIDKRDQVDLDASVREQGFEN